MIDIVKTNQSHDQAMEYAGLARLAHHRGEDEKAQALYRQALELEQHLAEELAATIMEPSRSVVHRSAGSLALICGEYRAAEKLIAIGLAGDPPDDIAHELRELFMQVFEQFGQSQPAGQ